MTRFELAVHLRERVHTRDVRKAVVSAGGLRFTDKPYAMKAARQIAKHPGVEWVNVSRVTLESVGRIKGAM